MSDPSKPVLSEDPNAGLATPFMDLLAALVIGAISIWMVVESLRLPVPGAILTAPGLLPFLTAASLLIMAGLLAVSALGRRRTLVPGARQLELPTDFGRSVALGGILVVYVLGLQLLPVEAAFTLGRIRFVIGAFEVATVLIVTAILRIYWKGALWACLAIALGWVAFLSIAFRIIFQTPLP
jgi:hypothetical protein